MALRKCLSCGGKMSSRAEKCPHCGSTQEQQEELRSSNKKRQVGMVLAIALCVAAAVPIGIALYSYDWHRCTFDTFYLPSAISAVLVVLGFLLCRRSLLVKLVGSACSLALIAAVLFVVWLTSSSYNYMKDPYSEWYRDHVFTNDDDFADLIKGTAWVADDDDLALCFDKHSNQVEITARLTTGDRTRVVTTYTVDGDEVIFDDFRFKHNDYFRWSGNFSVLYCHLKTQYSSDNSGLSYYSFRRLRSNELRSYGLISFEIEDEDWDNEDEKDDEDDWADTLHNSYEYDYDYDVGYTTEYMKL